MTNTRRNTIVLSSLLLIVIISTFYQTKSIKGKQTEIDKKNSLLMGQVAVLENQISNIDSLKREYLLQQELLAQQSKLLWNTDSPTITYNYLLKLLSWMQRDVIFDFATSTATEKSETYNQYVLSGRTHFAALLLLVNNIEHQRALLTVEELSIGNDNIANSDSISFSMIIRSHYKQGGAEPGSVTPKQFSLVSPSNMLFRVRVSDSPKPMMDDPRLINVDAVTLIGLSSDRAFFRDSQGIIKILSIGDRVNYGYLSYINQTEAKAVFRIDQYGIPEDKSLFLKKD